VQQAFTWDCGLACVLMVLRTLGIHCCHGIADLERLCRTTRFSLPLCDYWSICSFKYDELFSSTEQIMHICNHEWSMFAVLML